MIRETFRRSLNWSCNSSKILAITREVENGFRTNASSSSELREILLKLNFKGWKVVYYKCLKTIINFFSFFNNT